MLQIHSVVLCMCMSAILRNNRVNEPLACFVMKRHGNWCNLWKWKVFFYIQVFADDLVIFQPIKRTGKKCTC